MKENTASYDGHPVRKGRGGGNIKPFDDFATAKSGCEWIAACSPIYVISLFGLLFGLLFGPLFL